LALLKTEYPSQPIKLGDIKIYLIWFDSMGAKSSSLFIETPDIKLLVDPGAAGMQPSYPLTNEEKSKLRESALHAITDYSATADIVFISHYHYDHHTLPLEVPSLYKNKRLWIKDPNQWINRSQWERARLFMEQLLGVVFKKNMEDFLINPPPTINYEKPTLHLKEAMSQDYGDYKQRKEELLKRGEKWFYQMVEMWKKGPWVSEFSVGGNELIFIDGKKVKLGDTEIRFTPPLFHGTEYDRVGWVIGFTLEHRKYKLLYASDLQGPIIEDYASWIVHEKPNIIILDGATTYLFGYMLNRINLNRVIKNVKTILHNTRATFIIYDHHLLRDTRYKERVAPVYESAKLLHKNIITAAEWYGELPLILKLKGG
jgi:hypothetical protein